jgi:hypothetical protein
MKAKLDLKKLFTLAYAIKLARQRQERELRNLRECARSARRLCDWLGKNAGVNADWPVDLVCRDEAAMKKLCALLNDLEKRWKAAVGKKVKREH